MGFTHLFHVFDAKVAILVAQVVAPKGAVDHGAFQLSWAKYLLYVGILHSSENTNSRLLREAKTICFHSFQGRGL